MKIQPLTASMLLLFIITMSSAIATDNTPSTGVDSLKFLENHTNPEQHQALLTQPDVAAVGIKSASLRTKRGNLTLIL